MGQAEQSHDVPEVHTLALHRLVNEVMPLTAHTSDTPPFPPNKGNARYEPEPKLQNYMNVEKAELRI